MTHKEDSASTARGLTHPANAFLLEFRIADCEHLVDDEDVRLKVRRDRER